MPNLKQIFPSSHASFRVSIDALRVISNVTLVALMLAILSPNLVSAESKEDKNIENIRTKLVGMIPQAADAEILASPAEGVYRVQLQGGYAFAFTDGDYVLIGDLFDTEKRVNLGDEASAKLIANKVEQVPVSKMIVFGPEDAKRHITIFTDIDCGYCRKLHNEVAELNDAGVQVRYLAYPRAGVNSPSYDKYVSVWCNADQQDSLTKAKSGVSVPAAKCENPIAETFQLGQDLGIRGTPTIIFDDGFLAPGYIPADKLIARLGLSGEE